MIEVTQTTFGKPGGNCFEACIASLLEIDLETVPYFGEDGWVAKYERFLADFGLSLMTWSIESAGDWRPPGYWIGGIRCGSLGHSTVWKDDRMVWNPMPGWSAERTIAAGFPLEDISVLVVTDLNTLRRAG